MYRFALSVMYKILEYMQGRIEPQKAARGHATFVDGKMLSVTKYRIQIYWYKHVNRRRAPLMRSLTAKWFFEMAGIPSAAFVFDDDLATELETYAKANVELLSRVVNVALASGDTFSESGLLHW